MNKRTRQYIGLLLTIISYYMIHEGAHLLYALSIGTFKQINVTWLGMQIDVYADKMTQNQMGIFCLLGFVATAIISYILVALTSKIAESKSKLFKACMYYVTISLLFLDPLYLSVLCGFFGGGDMNGISLLIPEGIARLGFGIILGINIAIFLKIVYPRYKLSFEK